MFNFFHNSPPQVTRRIKMMLLTDIAIDPPYEEFLIAHKEDLLALKNKEGNTLICQVIPRQNRDKRVFVTDIQFNSEVDYQYYEEHYKASMVGKIVETYPQMKTLFRYEIKISSVKSTSEELNEFAHLLNNPDQFNTIDSPKVCVQPNTPPTPR